MYTKNGPSPSYPGKTELHLHWPGVLSDKTEGTETHLQNRDAGQRHYVVSVRTLYTAPCTH